MATAHDILVWTAIQLVAYRKVHNARISTIQ